MAADFGAPYDELAGIAAASGTDARAVGDYLDSQRRAYQTLTEHGDGTSWSLVPSPSRNGGYNFLAAAARSRRPTPGRWAGSRASRTIPRPGR